MEEKATKTSTGQRIFIGFIALLLLGSFIAVYAGIVLGKNNNNSSNNANIDQNKVNELLAAYTEASNAVEEATKPLSEKYFSDFSKYKSEIKSYNSSTANDEGLKTKDLKAGTGTALKENDTNYLAYYIGWCADESIFDSSFDNSDNPTSLKDPLDPAMGLIAGWGKGIAGMKVGGVREVTIPGELAYGEDQEICGGKNSPLKFIIMAIEKTDKLAELLDAKQTAYYRYVYYSNSGMDYDEMMKSAEATEAADSAAVEAK